MKKVLFLCLALFMALSSVPQANAAPTMSERLKGKILLQVEENGEAWYVNPADNYRYFLGRPADAFQVMREAGLGISEANYAKFNGQAPSNLSGKILLRVEEKGEAYYVNPTDLRMHYLGRPADAFRVMRELGLGITNGNLNQIRVHANSQNSENIGIENQKNLDGMIVAVDSCNAYSFSKQSVKSEQENTLTMTIDNEIVGDNGDGTCNYRYKISDVEVSLTDAQRQSALDAGKTEAEINKLVADFQNAYNSVIAGNDNYLRIKKLDLKKMLNRWKNQGSWELDNDMDFEIYHVWLDGSSLPGISLSGDGLDMSFVSVDGVDGTAVIALDGVEYTMEKNQMVRAGEYEFVYLGTKTEEANCTINGKKVAGSACRPDSIYIKFKHREL